MKPAALILLLMLASCASYPAPPPSANPETAALLAQATVDTAGEMERVTY